jgi:amphi-Trp domain-containing protein
MDIFEIEQKETVSRKEVATRLRRLATQLAKGNEVKFEQRGMTMKVHVPDEVQSRSRWRPRPTNASSRSS